MRRMIMAGAAVAALLTMTPATGGTVASGAPSPATGAENCRQEASGAKLRPGSQAKDPNSLTAAQVRAMQRALTARLKELPRSQRGGSSPGSIEVPVVWQVIRTSAGTGGVSADRIAEQLRVMNRGFRGATAPNAANTPFRFETRNIVRTDNSVYHEWDDADDRVAKRELRRGGKATLNVYVVNSIVIGGQPGVLGYATFPNDYRRNPDRDGVVVIRGSFPGGDANPYNKGDTLTHEVGHWIGLFHTFQNGCGSRGDRVDDTPAQDDGDNIFSCNKNLDTCPAKRGKDPVTNFMSYGTDKCLEKFTPGQSNRMDKQWRAFRA